MRVVVMAHVSGRMRLITGSERKVQPRGNTSSSQTDRERETLARTERGNVNTEMNRALKENANEPGEPAENHYRTEESAKNTS